MDRRIFSSHALQLFARRFLLLFLDGLLIVAAFYGAIALRLNNPVDIGVFLTRQRPLLMPAVVSGLGVLWLSGWYRGLTRYTGSYSLYGLMPRSFLMVILLLFISTRFYMISPPRSYWILYWLLFTGGSITMRIVMRDILVRKLETRVVDRGKESDFHPVKNTLIYGAGSSGLTLLMALRNDPHLKIIGYLDDDPSVHGRTLQNQVIYSPDKLPVLVEKYSVQQVLLAMSSIPRHRKRYLVDNLTHYGVKVLSIPSLSQLANGTRTVSDLKDVSIEDLLGREPSNPIPRLLSKSVSDKVVLVTGAGGSIGSELCRQVIQLNPKKLIMLELNEYALYSIKKELIKICPLSIVPILGNTTEMGLMDKICSFWKVETIFHASAYKHVPLVEENICAGVQNNVNGTCAVINAAKNHAVERVMLISTDKAVRPTNVMGASKRICELLIQSAADEYTQHQTIFSMVRFGNVLGSSGSVIPLFHEQIQNGGPVTVTHPSVTRYFMTIPEAVQLVLQSTGMAEGGDVYLLDMGEPVRIADLARQMIELSGLRVRDEATPDGDIEIVYSGLRPGEKLYEELLISDHDLPTEHPLIRKAHEPKNNTFKLNSLLTELEKAISQWDSEETYAIVKRIVPELTDSFINATPRSKAY